ncbi:hypothetical protein HU200_020531 [Digitaria exilis]|uniref:Uncharacterized protein n=1 Tax=Digitaria exilis TaxID=1010633 RepID=A0A835F278_9POAL|nr:hypothetical protein HU200_020531 [Digitaria exilis]
MALTFTVRRRDPELVRPAAPTPRETKRLSDIDGLVGFRTQQPVMFFYRGERRPTADDDDPAGVIRRALGEALVPYYPFAGRLREVEARRLVVDCTGEGVLFVEADADVRLAELKAADRRLPFPCADQLLCDDDAQGSASLFNCPLLLIQGGFVLVVRLNHAICDAIGLVQFLSAMTELARGLPAPTVVPSWSRELLEALPHHEPDAAADVPPPLMMTASPPAPGDDMVTLVRAIRSGLPASLRDTATSFEVLTSALWRAHTAALELPPHEDALLVFICNVRGVPELALPAGYYGNACVPVRVLTTVEALVAGSLEDTVEMVREAKKTVTAEYVRSVVALGVRWPTRPAGRRR